MTNKTVKLNTDLLKKYFGTTSEYARRTNVTFSIGSGHWNGKRIPQISQLCKIVELTDTKLDDWISYVENT